jgi:hypothetical protein
MLAYPASSVGTPDRQICSTRIPPTRVIRAVHAGEGGVVGLGYDTSASMDSVKRLPKSLIYYLSHCAEDPTG